MKERPILFSGPMVRAILDGRKTQTRRIVTTREPLTHVGPRGSEGSPDEWGYFFDGPSNHGYMVIGRGHNDDHDNGLVSIPCPYGEPGDRLWVKETFAARRDVDPDVDRAKALHYLQYRADADDLGMEWHDYGRHWRPSIFMPRWASRITLEVTEVRVQRLQEISEDDARSEGCTGLPDVVDVTPREEFQRLWDEINGKRAAWSSNPWVWALTFRRLP